MLSSAERAKAGPFDGAGMDARIDARIDAPMVAIDEFTTAVAAEFSPPAS
jgi:hypothetical protein